MATVSCSGCGKDQNFYKGVVHCAYCGRQYSGEQIAFSEVEYVRERFVGNWYAMAMALGIITLIFGLKYFERAILNVFYPKIALCILFAGSVAYCVIFWFAIKYIAKIRTPKLLARQNDKS